MASMVSKVAQRVFALEREEAGEEDKEIKAMEEEEQAATPANLPDVYQPTRSEYLDHCTTHYPFRAWCRHCLEGRGREFGHGCHNGTKDPRASPVVSFDYCFISDHGEVETDEQFVSAGDGAAKVLVVRDSRSKALFAHVVPSKGVDEKGFAVDSLVEDVRWLGYSRLTLKSDNEPAIVKLLTEALRELRVQGVEQVLEEHSPEYDPQSNGSAEVGVKLLKGHLRTLKSCLESQLGYRVPVQHPLVSWMVRHAADLVTWCAKGHDGQTAYQRVRARDFKTKLMGFGEKCRLKNRSQEPLARIADKCRFHDGIFVGVDHRTGQYMTYSEGEIRLARTVIRVPDNEKWDKDMLSSIKVTPWNKHVPRDTEVVFKDATDKVELDLKDKIVLSRQVYLRSTDFDEHGFTRGCPKCDAFRRTQSWTSTGRPHSKLCRDRLIGEISKTAAGRIRIGAAAERLDKTVEALGQQFRTDVPQGEQAEDVVRHQSPLHFCRFQIIRCLAVTQVTTSSRERCPPLLMSQA